MELKDLYYQSQVVQLKDSLADLVFEFLLIHLLSHVILEYQFQTYRLIFQSLYHNILLQEDYQFYLEVHQNTL